MLDLQRSVNRVSRSSLWSRAAGHLVVIGLVAVAAVGGLAAGRNQPVSTAGMTPGSAPSFPFSLVALANAAEASEEPLADLSLELHPENYVEPLAREGGPPDQGLVDELMGDTGQVIEEAAETGVLTDPVGPTAALIPDEPVPVEVVAAPLSWPVAGGSVSQYFYGGHLGIDIAAPWGTGVLAAGNGVVSYAGWRDNGGGYVIEILQDDGLVTVYNHLGGVWVAPGQVVTRGETIGAIGCTGLCTGPHVHFAVLVGGSAVNPLRYL